MPDSPENKLQSQTSAVSPTASNPITISRSLSTTSSFSGERRVIRGSNVGSKDQTPDQMMQYHISKSMNSISQTLFVKYSQAWRIHWHMTTAAHFQVSAGDRRMKSQIKGSNVSYLVASIK